MKLKLTTQLISVAAISLGITAAAPASAQADSFPSRAVHLILPYSPGSGPDALMRTMTDEIAKRLGQTVVIENRPGANGTSAITAFKSAKPDGHTVIMLDNSMTSINPHLYSDLPYDIEKDVAPLGFVMTTPFYLMVKSDGPIQSVQQMMDAAKKSPGKLSFGSPTGIGHVSHLAMEAFLQQAGLEMEVVPYKGTSPMLTDVTSGTLDMGWASYGSARGMVEAGGVKPIAVGAVERQSVAPDVPTMKEAGAPEDVEALAWVALFGPPGLPDDVAEKISTAFREVFRLPDVAKRTVSMGNGTMDGDGDAVRERIASESARFKKIIDAMGLKR